MTASGFQALAEFVNGFNPEPRPSARVHGGFIQWRGSTDHWSRLRPEEAHRLRGLFAMDPSAYAGPFVRDLDAAINEYEALHG